MLSHNWFYFSVFGQLQQLSLQAVQLGTWLIAPVGTNVSRKPESRFPAALDGVLSVGAHDEFGLRSPFSAKSYQLDLLVPGEGLLTSGPDQSPVQNTKSVGIAAAFVVGLLALVRQSGFAAVRSSEIFLNKFSICCNKS